MKISKERRKNVLRREREKNPNMMSLTVRKIAVLLVIVMILAAVCDAKRKKSKKSAKTSKILEAKQAKNDKYAKQLSLRDTTGPSFMVLLIMRLIYGIAVQMNAEDRISGWFNGAFVPPNADDDYGFGGGFEDFGGLEDLDDGGGFGDGIGGLFE